MNVLFNKKIIKTFASSIFCLLFCFSLHGMQEGVGIDLSLVTVISGPMFGGKTGKLIEKLREYEGKGKACVAIKHKRDVGRWDPSIYDVTDLISHDKTKMKAYVAGKIDGEGVDLKDFFVTYSEVVLRSVDVFGIDEGQFFEEEELIGFISFLTKIGKRVIIAGLDLNFKSEPFGVMGTLCGLDCEQIKLTARCEICGKDAMYSQRIVDGKPAKYDDDIVLVGKEDKYKPMCERCYVRPIPSGSTCSVCGKDALYCQVITHDDGDETVNRCCNCYVAPQKA